MDNRISIVNPTKHLMKIECPRCGDKYNKLLHYSKIRCNKCNLVFNPGQHNPDAHVVAFFSYPVLQRVSHFNETYIDCPLDHKSALIELSSMFKNQGSWEVTDIEIVERLSIKTTCKVCGFCMRCVTCSKCGTIYELIRKGQKCPKCNSIKTKKTYVPEFTTTYVCRSCGQSVDKKKLVCDNCGSKRVNVVRICPHCKKPDITPTIIKNKDKCPLCKTDNLEPRKKQQRYEICIRRLKAFWRDEEQND